MKDMGKCFWALNIFAYLVLVVGLVMMIASVNSYDESNLKLYYNMESFLIIITNLPISLMLLYYGKHVVKVLDNKRFYCL